MIAKRRPGVNTASQTDPVIDEAVGQLRQQIADLEHQLKQAHGTITARVADLHVKDVAEQKLKAFILQLQQTALDKTEQHEAAVRRLQAMEARAEAKERECAQLQKDLIGLKYRQEQGKKQQHEVKASKIRDEAMLVGRVTAAEARVAQLERENAQLRAQMQQQQQKPTRPSGRTSPVQSPMSPAGGADGVSESLSLQMLNDIAAPSNASQE